MSIRQCVLILDSSFAGLAAALYHEPERTAVQRDRAIA
jgi:hypothetical protein